MIIFRYANGMVKSVEYLAIYKILIAILGVAFIFPITGTYTFGRVYFDIKCNNNSTTVSILMVARNDTKLFNNTIPKGCNPITKLKAFAWIINSMFGKLENCKTLGNITIPFNGHPINATVVTCRLLPNSEKVKESIATLIASQKYGVILFTTSVKYSSKYGGASMSITIKPIEVVIRK